MIVYIFSCSNNPKIGGFTKDISGSNLPTEDICKKWSFSKEIIIEKNQSRIAADVNSILDAIDNDGYYIGEYSITIREIENI